MDTKSTVPPGLPPMEITGASTSIEERKLKVGTKERTSRLNAEKCYFFFTFLKESGNTSLRTLTSF